MLVNQHCWEMRQSLCAVVMLDKQYRKGSTLACMSHSFLAAPQVITGGERQMLLFPMMLEMAFMRKLVIWFLALSGLELPGIQQQGEGRVKARVPVIVSFRGRAYRGHSGSQRTWQGLRGLALWLDYLVGWLDERGILTAVGAPALWLDSGEDQGAMHASSIEMELLEEGCRLALVAVHFVCVRLDGFGRLLMEAGYMMAFFMW
ncbi:hypothetical protein EDD85DRAFT_792117 [Armillaria nabsnona]|nr:hypothetical protein EDD85DRAFT_792117 [Armillaria nabsnona]